MPFAAVHIDYEGDSHHMRGTVLLVTFRNPPELLVDHLRENGLIVHESTESRDALAWLRDHRPDVIVTGAVASAHLPAMRREVDQATSIIVVGSGDDEQNRLARDEGADLVLPTSASPADVAYAIHRALILRRSGRRLTG